MWKDFSWSSGLPHKRFHADARLYEFKECGIIYRITSALKAHQRILIDLKHYELKSGKSFIGNGELIQRYNIRKYITFRSLTHVRRADNPLYGNVTELMIPRL